MCSLSWGSWMSLLLVSMVLVLLGMLLPLLGMLPVAEGVVLWH